MYAATVPENLSETESDTDRLVEALAKLPPRQRAAVILHYYVGYRAREIAVITGSTAATVRVHLSQGRRRLRRLLEALND